MKKYENYVSALNSLRKAPEQDLGNDFIQSGIIDKFGLQFELGWKLFKALLAYEGDPVSASGSPRDVLKTAFNTMISWTNRCGCACCAIAMILLISMMKNELGVLWTPSSLITSPSLSVQIRGWSLATVKH